MSILNTFDLTGKTAIVTGGGRGLGKGIAEGLCEAGASVVIIGSSNSVINTAKEFTDKGFIAYAIKGDLSNKELIPTIVNEALSKLNGKIDILINNAGIQRRHKCEEFPLSDWEAVLQVNLNTVFMLCKKLAFIADKLVNCLQLFKNDIIFHFTFFNLCFYLFLWLCHNKWLILTRNSV